MFFSENNYLALLNLQYELGNGLKGYQVKDDREFHISMFTFKVLAHCSSAFTLWRDNTAIPEVASSVKGMNFPDFSSVYVLSRSALEAYLLFYYFYKEVSLGSDDFEYRITSWELEYYLGRQTKFKNSTDTEILKTLSSELADITRIAGKLSQTNEYQKADCDRQKKILKAKNWRPSWSGLATRSGIPDVISNKLYWYLSGIAHSGIGSLGLLENSANQGVREEHIRWGLTCNELVLSKFAVDLESLYSAHLSTVIRNNSEDWRIANEIEKSVRPQI